MAWCTASKATKALNANLALEREREKPYRFLLFEDKKDVGQVIPLSIEAKLNDRQKKIITHILKEGFVTSGWCVKKLKVVQNTAYRDLTGLIKLDILEQTGKGRSTRYVFKKK